MFITEANHAVAEAIQTRHDLTDNASRFMNGSASLTNEVRAYAATAARVHYYNYLDEIDNLKNRDIGVENLKAIGLTAGEEQLIEQMSNLSNNLVPLEIKAMELVDSGDIVAALAVVYSKDYEDTIYRIRLHQISFLAQLDYRSAKAVNEAQETADNRTTLFFIFLLITAVLQVLSMFLMRRKIIRPLIMVKDEMNRLSHGRLSTDFALKADTSEIGVLISAMLNTKSELNKYIFDISQKLNDLAHGDMSAAVDIDYIGDFQPIQVSLTTILESLNTVMSEINIASKQVAAGADLIAQNARELAGGAGEQAQTIEQFNGSIHRVNSMAEENRQTSGEALGQADEMIMLMASSLAAVKQAVESMQNIDRGHQNISRIIKVIDDIAFQTNILALNAAIEAARAGQHGKGFAVVADEVRNLASKSAEAARETATLIDESAKSVYDGNEVVSKVNIALEDFRRITDKMVESISRINDASSEQSAALSQIADGVNQLDEVVRSNSSNARQSAASAMKMSAQAENLAALIAGFKLREAGIKDSSQSLASGARNNPNSGDSFLGDFDVKFTADEFILDTSSGFALDDKPEQNKY